MLECCRSVFLDKEMANPGGAIARNQSQWKQPPSAGSNEVTQRRRFRPGAYQMKQASRGLAVFGHVMRPEFAE